MTMQDRIGGAPLSAEDAARPRWLTRAELLSNYAPLQKSERGPFLRTYYAGLRATGCEQGLFHVPVGQGGPLSSIRCEHLITVLEGEVEFNMVGERIVVEKFGQLFIPSEMAFDYRNVGMADAWFHNVLTRVNVWPALPAAYPE